MRFIADLHIHSRFSMATSSDLNLENLYVSARKKGITLVGTGDFTHPEWFAEMKDRLVPAEQGLYRLRPDLEKECEKIVPVSCVGEVRFMLQAEISCIYKKDGKVRKNHNLLYFPTLESVDRFNARLSGIGNIKSDGRPILGLDSRDLLEILLETDDRGFLIPAHIWTPWFSLLGSKSGFDSLDECYGDLSDHIFAAETGLSSDPAMNWRVPFLDRITLISNSDAHSPAKLGREANLFDTDLSYEAIRSALEFPGSPGFLGTLEFFPEEGKYHMDGHRKCGVMLNPCESMKAGGICHVCGGKMTLGVLYRVEELADAALDRKPENARPFHSIIPLTDIIAEIHRVGASSKKVASSYKRITEILGPELGILYDLDIDKIKAADIPLLGLAIEKMRNHDIVLAPGYDGEFGTVRIFTEEERNAASGQKLFFDIKAPQKKNGPDEAGGGKARKDTVLLKAGYSQVKLPEAEPVRPERPALNPEQASAVEMPPCHMIITAGPGTGKTRTITHRIAHLMNMVKVPAFNIAAITFTNRAAEEMRHRLKSLLEGRELPFTGTFHSLCFTILKDAFPEKKLCVIDQQARENLIGSVAERIRTEGFKAGKQEISEYISMKKPGISGEDAKNHENKNDQALSRAFEVYQDLLDSNDLLDFDDLMGRCLEIFGKEPLFLKKWQDRLGFVFIDEYQDLDHIQYHFIRLLCGGCCHVCAIGDPDQSIYGFRGGSSEYFERFCEDFKGAEKLKLIKNYRSSKTILDASFQMIRKGEKDGVERAFSDLDGKKSISIIKGTDEYREASLIVSEIERLLGGTSHYSINAGRADGASSFSYGFSDFAVLYRTKSQADAIISAFDASGIPFQAASRENFWDRPGIRQAFDILSSSLGLGGSALGSCQNYAAAALKDRIADAFSAGGVSGAVDFVRSSLCELGQINESSGDFAAWDRLMDISGSYGHDAARFFSDLALMSDQDVLSAKAQRVSLMTLHASKGLEFPVVFISGCEKDYLPYQRKGAEVCTEEERRLFFVGMTRAKERLYLSWAGKRRVFGKTEQRLRSPFLEDIEANLLEQSAAFSGPGRRKTSGRQMELF